MSKSGSKPQVVKLEQVFIVDKLSEFRNKAEAAMKKPGGITIVSDGEISEIDLAAVQYLVYLHEKCKKEERTLKMDISFSTQAEQLIERSGLSHFLEISNQ